MDRASVAYGPSVGAHERQMLNGVDMISEQDERCQAAQKYMAKADSLALELEALHTALEPNRKAPTLCGLSSCIRSLKKERTMLESIAPYPGAHAVGEDAFNKLHKKLDAAFAAINRCLTNWAVLKRCSGFVAMNQTFQSTSKEHRREEVSRRDVKGKDKGTLHRTLKDQGKVEVQVVGWGREWVDVRSLLEDRLARHMTDCGWAWGEHSKGDVVDAEEWEDIPLAKQLRRLVAAAKLHRHQYHIPHVRVVLPNVSRKNHDVDVLFDQLSGMDPFVKLTIEDMRSNFLGTPPPCLDMAIQNLVGDELETLTPTLNLDHTLLVDLISDITHLELQPQPWQHGTTRAQIEEETAQRGLMARTLYPLLDGRTLVCTKEAAEHFHNLLKTVGTETERERGRLLVPPDAHARSMTTDAIRSRFQALSTHPLPPTVQIPITVLAEDWSLASIHHAVEAERLPRVALDVARASAFKSSKLSIFAYGWASDNVTLTSNKEIRGQIRTWVEAHRHDDRETGPVIWRVDVTRNLLSKSASPREGDVEWAETLG